MLILKHLAIRSCCAMLALAISSVLAAQESEVRFNRLTSEDGLSADAVTAFVQDERGYMWIGTTDGLNRYDGRRFEVYRTAKGDSGICGNNVRHLKIDDSGTIWIGTYDGGLCSLDPIKKTFQHYPVRTQIETATEKVMALSVESPNTVHVGFEKTNRVVLDVATGKYSIKGDTSLILNQTDYALHYSPVRSGLYHSPIHSGVLFAKDGVLNAITDPNRSEKNLNKQLFPAYTANEFLEEQNGTLWFGAWDNALHRYDPSSDSHTYFTLDDQAIKYNGDEIIDLEFDASSMIWLGTRDNGLFFFDPQRSSFQRFQTRENDDGAFIGKRVEAIYRDRQNRMWVGTEMGVAIHDPLLDQFGVRYPTALEGKTILAFHRSGDSLLIGHNTGVCVLNNGKYFNYDLEHDGKQLSVGSIYKDELGRILLGTNKSVFVWNHNGTVSLLPEVRRENLEQYRDIRSSFVSDIADFHINNTHHLLAFFYGHDLFVMDAKSGFGTPNHVGWEKTYENLVRGLRVDQQGRLWAFGASKGVVLITDPFNLDSINKAHSTDPKKSYRYTLEVRSYFDAGNEQHKLSSNDVSDMLERDDGKFWVSTLGGGLFLFDPDSEDQTFTELGCPINSLYKLVMDDQGMLWASHKKGLLSYDPATGEYQQYAQQYGIPTSGLTRALYRDADGMMHAGGKGFYLQFDPADLRKNGQVAKSYLDNIQVNGEAWSGPIEGTEFSHKQNFITFSFSAPNLTDPKNNAYSYKLEGVDDAWRLCNGPVEAQYTSLPPGDHTLMLRASNNDGIWNEATQAFSFTIVPPWYNRWWFYVLVVMTIAAILYALYKYRVDQIRKLYEVRNTIAKDLHDDIGATLGSISIYSQVAKNRMKEPDKADEVIDIIGETSRRMVDRIGDIVWAVDPKNDQLDQSIKRMNDFASTLCNAKDVNFQLEADEASRAAKLSMVQRKNLFLIFKEAIHNALKYADCRNIKVSMALAQDQFSMTIVDDGEGFDLSNNHSYNGNGLMNMRSRSEELHGNLEVKTSPGEGCSIEMKMTV